MKKGKLEDYLNKNHKTWSWKKRVKICLQVGYALQRLHSPTTLYPGGRVHGSVNSTNILLDENWDAKLSNFNDSNSTLAGKPQDVYAFGTLLINVLLWENQFTGFHRKFQDNDFWVLVQKEITLEEDELSPDSIKTFTDVVRKCLHPGRYKRPTIDVVVSDLEAALNFQELLHPPQPNMLVFKHMENGKLEDYLNKDHKIWSWKKRVKICLQVGYALQHLHSPTTKYPGGIVHGSVNSANILLDENWNAKLSNFNNSNSTLAGYIQKPKDVYELGSIHKPQEVYAFGTLLINILHWDNQYYSGFHRKYEDNDFWVLVQTRIINDVLDLEKDELSTDSIEAFTNVVKKCLHPDRSKRPTIDAVVLGLEAALDFQELLHPPQPIPEVDPLNTSASSRESILIRVTESESLDEISEATNELEKIMSSSSSFQIPPSSCSSTSLLPLCRRFSLDEIKKATNNFDLKKCLGKGGEGTVYQAQISLEGNSDKSLVAVKHLHKSLTDQFEKEIVTMAKLRHPNIVSLLGYSQELDDNVLVYEYMENGSLSKYVKKNSKVCLSWKQRLNICLGVAKGLEHLHKKTDEFPKGIIHRDVKPENILIDDNWVAKISDFGMLKLSNPAQTKSTMATVNLKGTPGYFAPETLSGKISKKIDVYAFGFMMFEVLCRKKRWDTGEDESIYLDDEDDIGLLAEDNVDIEIKDQISNYSRRLFIDIIVECMQSEPIRRPTMDKVVRKLEKALKN